MPDPRSVLPVAYLLVSGVLGGVGPVASHMSQNLLVRVPNEPGVALLSVRPVDQLELDVVRRL